jgi:hypothetical protein
MESMKERTLRDLIGDIKRPGYLEKIKSFILGMKTSQSIHDQNKQFMTKVDQICYKKAKNIIDGQFLDIGYICKENR